MKVKVSEATGPTLNWMVAQCEEVEVQCIAGFLYIQPAGWAGEYKPSEWWAQGGPIIEREWVNVEAWPNETDEHHRWQASCDEGRTKVIHRGPTPLIAAMRCYAAMKLGDEVEVPDLLLESK